jgi:putative hydrolase of the HAD superfamily
MKYSHLLFDLDHTLWDFERNSSEALNEVYSYYNMQHFNTFSSQEFVDKFKEINTILWEKYDRDEIDREFIRTRRFEMVLSQLGIKNEDIPDGISNTYLSICPTKGNVIPDAFEVLDYLKGSYEMHIITNGFDDIQDTKLNSSNLRGYFDRIFTSEAVGYKKPSKEMFNKAVEMIGVDKKSCLMIGDNLETDIKGALNADLDVVYFNPDNLEHDLPVTFEIRKLRDLKAIL